MATFVVAKVTVVVEFSVPTAVNTPTGDMVEPGNGPYKGRVLTVLSMANKFWPGCAMSWFAPEPYES